MRAGSERLRDRLGRALAAGGGRRLVRQPGAAAERQGRHDLALPGHGDARASASTPDRSSSATRSSTASRRRERPRARPDLRQPAHWQTKTARLHGGLRLRRRTTRAPRATASSSIQHSVDLERPAVRRGARAQRRGDGLRQRHAGRLRHRRSRRPRSARAPTCTEDKRTVVIEGIIDPAVGGVYTGTDDDLLIQLAKRRTSATDRRRQLSMDADEPAGDLARASSASTRAGRSTSDGDGGTYYTITFRDPARPEHWETPVRVRVNARDDATARGSADRRHQVTCDTTATPSAASRPATNPARDLPVPEPPLRPGPDRRHGDRQRDGRRRRSARAASAPSSSSAATRPARSRARRTTTGCA